MENKLILWLWLNEIFGTANSRKWTATSRFDSIEECYDAISHGDCHGLTYEETVKSQAVTLDDLRKHVEYCARNDINIYCYESEGFPQRLRDIFNPPAVIYAKHKLQSLDFLDDNVTVAVVGARNADSYYLKATEEISGQLAAAGVTVASGFALGVDSAAHKAAVANGGKTIAVLGSGINYDYPKGKSEFKDEIVNSGGVIMSEFPPDHHPMYNDFKARNRILSGISLGVLVTQASMTSGSLNTVSHAVSQGKDIFCIPPRDIFDEKYMGVSGLIRDGAISVFDARDILCEYSESYSHKISYAKSIQYYKIKSEDSVYFATGSDTNKSSVKSRARKAVSNNEKSAEEISKPKITIREVSTEGLSENQIKIVEALKGKQLLADEISLVTDIDVVDLFGELTELEIMNKVKSLPGNRYSL